MAQAADPLRVWVRIPGELAIPLEPHQHVDPNLIQSQTIIHGVLLLTLFH